MLETQTVVPPRQPTGTLPKPSRRIAPTSRVEPLVCRPSGECRRLSPTRQFDDLQSLAQTLKSRVLGQVQATDALISSLSRLLSGLRDPSRPLLTALLLGPTGVGKTETARALAQGLFGDERSLIRINCEEFAHGHEIAKLLGSPPGYVGQEIEPLLSQERIDAPHLEARESSDPEDLALADFVSSMNGGRPISIVLFDEIEKADPVVWSSLLGILEEGSLTLGDNRAVDFTRTIVLMTSNVGSRAMGEILDPHPMGFNSGARNSVQRGLEAAVLDAARGHFPPEFLNRFDEQLVFRPLGADSLQQIFGKFLDDIHHRALHQAKTPLLLKVSPRAEEWIIDQGTDPALGARPLRRAMERHLVDPLSRLIASHQLEAGDVVEIALEQEKLAFYRRRRESQKIIA